MAVLIGGGFQSGGCGPHGGLLRPFLCAEIRSAAIPSSPPGAGLAFQLFGLLLLSGLPELLGFGWVRLCGGGLLPCLECCVLHCRRPVSAASLYIWEGPARLNG